MGLQVWLPLNGNIDNQGLSNYQATNTNAIINTNGKIGKCYQFGPGQSYLELPKECMRNLSTECTVSFWIKIITRNSNYETYFQAGLGGIAWNNYVFGLLRNNNGNSCCFTISNGSSASNANYTTPDLTELNTWYHITLVYKTGHCLVYMNGELYQDYTTTIIPAFDKITTITIGCGNTKTSYQTNCLINDFRIYDTALSPREIKEISKGLVLHYPLNRGGFGQDNLITQTMIDNEPWASAIQGTYIADGKMGWILRNSLLYSKSGSGANNIFQGLSYEENTQYTISFKWRDDYRTDGKSSMLFIRFKYSDGTYTEVISSKSYTYWKEETMTSTIGKTVVAITTTYGNGGDLLFTDLKLEKGAIKTPFSPIVNSDEYIAMGLNSTIEYDVSGYGNNGTRNGTFSWSGDTPRYGCSTIFNGADNAIQTPNLTTMITDKNYTISCWTYKTTIGTKNYQTIYGGPSGFELEARSSSNANPLFRLYNWGGGTTPYVFGEWTHFCFVHTDSDSKLYVNGELKITGSSVNIPSGNYYIGAWSVATSQNYDGLMSDFRIYATALSADDVMALYHTPISLANNGALLTQGEYVES